MESYSRLRNNEQSGLCELLMSPMNPPQCKGEAPSKLRQLSLLTCIFGERQTETEREIRNSTAAADEEEDEAIDAKQVDD